MNHLALYDQTTLACSKLITKRYSTSFSLGIRTLHKSLHEPIYAIYGFVRYADEIVDTFHQYDKALLLERFRQDTYRAIEEKISLNPVLHSFQMVVNRYHIERELIDAFLHSMEMDLEDHVYDPALYHEYIYGSAEVVGLMCLRVFCNGNDAQYQQLKSPAKSLGAAFQKVNFLRDIRSDFKDRGRVYFPNVNFEHFSEQDKRDIEQDIQRDFEDAYLGIVALPAKARAGVYLAYIYYLQLFRKIKSAPPAQLANERIRIPDSQKVWLLVATYFKIRLGLSTH